MDVYPESIVRFFVIHQGFPFRCSVFENKVAWTQYKGRYFLARPVLFRDNMGTPKHCVAIM